MNASGNDAAKTALSVSISLINDTLPGDFGQDGADVLPDLSRNFINPLG